MPCVLSDFHQNVRFLQSLVLEAAAGSPSDRSKANSSSSSNANQHYNIRRCLRHIQGLIARDDFVLPEISDGSSSPGGGTNPFFSPEQQAAGPLGHEDSACSAHRGHDTDDNSNKKKIYRHVTEDLITLLTMNFEVVGDPSIAQLVRDAMVPRVIGLLETAPSLMPTQLHDLLHRLLLLLKKDSESSRSGGSRSESEENDVHLLPLLELFNRHVTNYEHLHSVLSNDQELFVALDIALHYREVHHHHHQQAIQAPPPLALAILINSLIEYWTFHCLAASSGGNGGRQGNNDADDDDNDPRDLNTWLQYQFLQQPQTIASPDMLRNEVDAYVANVERYGTHLVESTLRLLEEASSQYSSGVTTTGQNTATSTIVNGNQDEEDQDVIILKYAMLATSFLAAMHTTTFSLYQGGSSAAFAMSRSLWQEYVNFLVQGLSSNPNDGSNGDSSRRDGTCGSVTMNGTSSVFTTRPSAEEQVQLAVAATDTLWRLAQLHYPNRSPSSSSSTGKKEDIPLITATILRLWKHATHYWNESTVDWIRYQLQYCGKDLGHSLQAMILSYIYFPHQNSIDSYPREPVETLMELVLHESTTTTSASRGDVDPWKGWVAEQLSNDMGQFVVSPGSQ